MHKIPVSRSVFDHLFYTYDLRCYCGHAENNEFIMPGSLNNVEIGSIIKLFCPGKCKTIREREAEVLSLDPIVLRILRMQPEFKIRHPGQYAHQQEARLGATENIITE